ncbi:MAG: GntR family transcriptional regulator [Phycisphaerae bacterium]|nr:GntR family transcriptional regulator [Phycisphaerae bacterium]
MQTLELTAGNESTRPQRVTTRQWLHDCICERILSGKHPPGSKLVQEDLANEYNVGRGILREALLQLQQFGLVDVVANRGFFVAQLNAKKLLDAHEMREVHDGLAARLCCGRITPEQADELETIVRRIHQLGVEGKTMDMGFLDRQYHDRLVAIAGNDILSDLVDKYRYYLRKIVVDRPQEPRIGEETLHEHLAVIDAIRHHRPDDAERLARAHVHKIRLENEEKIRKGEFRVEWLAVPPKDRNERDDTDS